MRLEKAEASEYGKRAQKNRRQRNKICIEGEYLNIDEIAARLGVGYDCAAQRLQRARKRPGAITWAVLGL